MKKWLRKMPVLRDALPKMVVEVLKKYDITVSDVEVEVRRLKPTGWSLRVKSATISLIGKQRMQKASE